MKSLIIISLNADPLKSFGSEHGGGQAKYILELGKNLVLEGWNIDVMTIKNNGYSEFQSVTEGFNVYRFSLPENNDYSYSITESDIEYLYEQIRCFLKKEKHNYNLIFCCYWLSGIIGVKIRNEIFKNVLISFCSLGYFKKIGSNNSTANLDLRIATEKKVANDVDHIIVTSNEERLTLINIYNVPTEKISVIPRGIDLNVFYEF